MKSIIILILVLFSTLFAQNTIIKVYDGDTFQIDTGDKVRLLGIDTPEKCESGKLDKDRERSGKDKETIKALGQLASDYTEKLLLNQKVLLLADSADNDKERYGSLLRYAHFEDVTLFNLKIILEGYAYAYSRYPVIFMQEFLEAQREVSEINRDLWGDVNSKEMK